MRGEWGQVIAWVKEGRKYDLGAVLITQQPGSIAGEILSQGDNWFVFHLLSATDLQTLQRANAHFSDDILSALLNEPIEGNGVHWSSAGGRGYPIPVRILAFENLYKTRDPEYKCGSGGTFAVEMLAEFQNSTGVSADVDGESPAMKAGTSEENQEVVSEPLDLLEKYTGDAIETLRADSKTISNFKGGGVPWFGVQSVLAAALPNVIDASERRQMAFAMVSRAMNDIVGEGNWKTEKRTKKSGPGLTTWIVPAPEKTLFEG